MAEDGLKHKLAAILITDVAGFSRLIAEDGVSSFRIPDAYRDEMTALPGMFDAGAQVEIVNLREKKVKKCIGCFT